MLSLFLGAVGLFASANAQTLGYDWNGFTASTLGCGSDSGAINVGLGQSLPTGATGLKVKQIAFAIYGTNSLPAFIQLDGSTGNARLSTSGAVQCCGSGCDLAVQVGVAGYSWYNSPCGQPSCSNANKWYYMDFSTSTVGTTEQTGISQATFYNSGGTQIGANMINLGSGSVFFMSYTAIIPSPTPTPSVTKSPVSPSLTASETASTTISRSVSASTTISRSVSASESIDATTSKTGSGSSSGSKTASGSITGSRSESRSISGSRSESASVSGSRAASSSLSGSVTNSRSESGSVSGSRAASPSVTTSRLPSPSFSGSTTASSSATPTVTPYIPWFQGLVGCCHNSIDTSIQALNVLTPYPYPNMGINRISIQYWPLAAGTATFTIALMNVAGGSFPGGFILASKTFSVTSPGSFPTYSQQVATFTDLDPISSYVLGGDVEYAIAFYNATPGIIDLVVGVPSLSPFFWNSLMTESTGSFYTVGETNPPEVTNWIQSSNIAFVAVGAGSVLSSSPSPSLSITSSSTISASTSSSVSLTTTVSQSTSGSITVTASQSTSISSTASSSESATTSISETTSVSSSMAASSSISPSPTATLPAPWFTGMVGCCHNPMTAAQAVSFTVPSGYINTSITRIALQYWPDGIGDTRFLISLMASNAAHEPTVGLLATAEIILTSPGSFPSVNQQAVDITDLGEIAAYPLNGGGWYSVVFYAASNTNVQFLVGNTGTYIFGGGLTPIPGYFYTTSIIVPPVGVPWYTSTNTAFIELYTGPVQALSVSPTESTSMTGSVSLSASVSTGPTSSSSVSQTSSLTATRQPTVSATSSLSTSLSVSTDASTSSSVSTTQSGTASSSGSGSTAVTVSGSQSISAQGSSTQSATASSSGSGTTAVTGSRSVSVSQSISGLATVTESGTASSSGSGTTAVTGSRSVSGSQSVSGVASVTESGTTSVSISVSNSLTVSATQSGSASISTLASTSISASVTQSGSTTASTSQSISNSETLTTTETVSRSLSMTFSSSTSLSQTISLSLSPSGSVSISTSGTQTFSHSPVSTMSFTATMTPLLFANASLTATPSPLNTTVAAAAAAASSSDLGVILGAVALGLVGAGGAAYGLSFLRRSGALNAMAAAGIKPPPGIVDPNETEEQKKKRLAEEEAGKNTTLGKMGSMIGTVKALTTKASALADKLPLPDSVKKAMNDPTSLLPKSAKDMLDTATGAAATLGFTAASQDADVMEKGAATPAVTKKPTVSFSPVTTLNTIVEEDAAQVQDIQKSNTVVEDGGIQLQDIQKRNTIDDTAGIDLAAAAAATAVATIAAASVSNSSNNKQQHKCMCADCMTTSATPDATLTPIEPPLKALTSAPTPVTAPIENYHVAHAPLPLVAPVPVPVPVVAETKALTVEDQKKMFQDFMKQMMSSDAPAPAPAPAPVVAKKKEAVVEEEVEEEEEEQEEEIEEEKPVRSPTRGARGGARGRGAPRGGLQQKKQQQKEKAKIEVNAHELAEIKAMLAAKKKNFQVVG